FTMRGPTVGYSSRTSITTSRIANSSCVACEEVVTLFNTTVPDSMSSASLRNATTALASFSPKACFPARSAHSTALIVVLLPLIMSFSPYPLKNGPRFFLLPGKFSGLFVSQMLEHQRGTFRIVERSNCKLVIKTAELPGDLTRFFSIAYG